MSMFSKLKCPADVISDERDTLDPVTDVAIYYDNDPDDLTPLFGDSSPAAVELERDMLLRIERGDPSAALMHAHLQALMCRGYMEVKGAREEITNKDKMRRKGPEEAAKNRMQLHDAFWEQQKPAMLARYKSGKTVAPYIRDLIAKARTWPVENPRQGYAPALKTIRGRMEKILENLPT